MADTSCLIIREQRIARELLHYAGLKEPFVLCIGEPATGRRFGAIMISRHTHSEIMSNERSYQWWFENILTKLTVGGKVVFLD